MPRVADEACPFAFAICDIATFVFWACDEHAILFGESTQHPGCAYNLAYIAISRVRA